MLERTIRDRIRGSLLAGAAGDALGYAVEFERESDIARKYGPEGIRAYDCDPYCGKALISDDTQMTLFTAAGILSAGERPIRASVAEAYRDWLITQNLSWSIAAGRLQRGEIPDRTGLFAIPELFAWRAPGNTCLAALYDSEKHGDPTNLDFIAHPCNHSKGCGGVMRVAPAAWIPGLSAEQAAVEAAQFAAVTHGHPLGWLPAAALAYLTHEMTLTDRSLREITLDVRRALPRLFPNAAETMGFCTLLNKTLVLAENDLPDIQNIHCLGEGWVGDEALAIALYCALRHEDDLSACLIASVNHRGDSDSTGAVAGNILGARIGEAAMEEKWKTDLELRELIQDLADRLAEAWLAGTKTESQNHNTEVPTMNENIIKRNTLLAQKVIKGLQSRNMSGYWAESKEEALRLALELIPKGSTVTMGGAMSAHEIGLVEALKTGDYHFIDRDKAADRRAAMLAAYDADVFLSSCNAMTEDGVLINIDGNSNRVSAIAQGPKKVVMIVGMNKVCSDVDGAMKRARNVAAPINAQRFGLSTPCAKTGACMNCKSPDTICCQFLITRFSRHPGRIHVILVNDSLGF